MIYRLREKVIAQRFDPRTFKAVGPPSDVADVRVVQTQIDGCPMLSASFTGTLVQRCAVDRPRRLMWYDRNGRFAGIVPVEEGLYAFGAVSADGHTAVVVHLRRNDTSTAVWQIDLDRGSMHPLEFRGSSETPLFGPDGRTVYFANNAAGLSQDIWSLRTDAPGSEHMAVRTGTRFISLLSLTPDGRQVLVRSQGTDTQQDLYVATLGDSAGVRPLVATRFNEPTGTLSPDGRWIAYITDETGRYELRVRAFPSLEGPIIEVSHGAWSASNDESRIGKPRWSRDGRELIYTAPDARTLMSVAVTPGDPPRFGEPHALFRLPDATADLVEQPDLQRFLVAVIRDEEGRSGATVITNWKPEARAGH